MRLSKLKSLLQLGLTIILCSVLNVLVIEHPYRLDLTTAKIYSLSESTQKVVDKISKPVHIVFAYDMRNRALKDSASTLRDLANKSKFISVQMFDPILEPSL
ncbi:MAG: Gldg family protein, partial [Pseudomonadota bacterium]|nr:Gldg family protein [Pseudomonadota bacterium]